MKRVQTAGVLALGLMIALPIVLGADVKTQEKTQIKFEGTLGRVVGLFGGKAAREGLVDTVAVHGDRKAKMNEYSGQIIDLAEEKVYDVDVRGKSFKVTTFAELRKQLEEARKKAEEEARRAEPRKEDPSEKQYEVDFDVKDTGQRKTINGFDTHQVIATITVREKGKTLEQSGGIVLTADSWLAPPIAALNEVAEFDRRYFQKLYGTETFAQTEQMLTALAMWPGLKEAMAKYQAEGSKFDGTPINTVMTFHGVKSAEQAAAAEKEPGKPSGVGGMLGGLGRRIAKKKPEEGSAAAAGRTPIMTMTNEVLSVTPGATAADVAVPAGFRQK